MVNYVRPGTPFVDLPATTTPTLASWFNGVDDSLTDLAASGGRVPTLETAVAGKQASDADLTAIAALDSTTAGALVTDGSGWIRKTYAQLKTALGLVKADVGLGSVDNTADTAKPVSTAQAAAIAAATLAARPDLDVTGAAVGGLYALSVPSAGQYALTDVAAAAIAFALIGA